MTAANPDIDDFIRQQKAKLAHERQTLDDNQKMHTEYQQIWTRQNGGQSRQHKSFESALGQYKNKVHPLDIATQKEQDLESYRKIWFEVTGQHQEPGSQCKKWGEPVKLSPRGYLDTSVIITEVEKENATEEYRKQWKEMHGGQEPTPGLRDTDGGGGKALNTQPTVPGYLDGQSTRDEYHTMWRKQNPQGPEHGRAPAQARMAPGYLDTAKIIQEVEREKREEEKSMRLNFPGAKANVPSPRGGGPIAAGGGSELDDYRKTWNQQHQQESQTETLGAQAPGELRTLLIGGQDEYKQRLKDEMQKEYNEFLRKARNPKNSKKVADQYQDEPLPLGGHEEYRKKLKEERHKDYLEFQKTKRGYQGHQGPSLKEQTDDHKASTLLANESDSTKLEKLRERNNEYRDFLSKRAEMERHRFDDKKPPQHNNPQGEPAYATLPGIRYSNSAQKVREKREERNREYNEMMRQKRQRNAPPPAVPKQGWRTPNPNPNYEHILEKKREEEAGFRKANDTGYQPDYNARETELRIKGLDRDLAAKRADEQPNIYNGILEDPYWLSHRDSNAGQYVNNPPIGFSASQHAPNLQDGQYYASLPLGDALQTAELRRKEEYATDLRIQMEQTKFARKKERQEGILVNNTGAALQDPKQLQPRTSRYNNNVQPYHTEIYGQLKKMDDINISPRPAGIQRQPTEVNHGLGGLNQARHQVNTTIYNKPSYNNISYGDPSNLGLDIDMSILERPSISIIDPPPGLKYQPSTFITANAVPVMNSSVDEAYNFYGTLNPLDPNKPAALIGGGGDVPSLNLSGLGGAEQNANSRVRFQDNRGRQLPAVGMDFATDDDRKQEQKQGASSYREELERQIHEKNMKKVTDREDQERYDRKMEEEARNYDPFGKGGGGAPMRDPSGNVITDLRQMRNDNHNPNSNSHPDLSPRGYGGDYVGGGGAYGNPRPVQAGGNTTRASNSYRDDLIGPPPTQTTADGNPSFARGGHGIFGMPKTDGEKMQADKYKVDLKRQIEEKKADELRKKQQQKLEDEREQKILDEQRARIQREYEEEQRKAKAKEDEARHRNDEMIRLAEDKKREIGRQRREEADIRQQELTEEREREFRERNAMASPVPATRTITAEQDPRPLPRRRLEPTPRAQSADVLNQLADMRQQLRKERQRVQNMLDDQEDDVEIYDPRYIQKPPPAPVVKAPPEIDVFETAMNRNAVALRRTVGDRASAQAVEDFNALKHKNDSDSRKRFRQMFPNEPVTSEGLETQQLALLRQQEDRLQDIKDRRALEDTSALQLGRDIRSSTSQLHSNSAFVEVNGVAHFPDDFEDMPRRNDSARARRRARPPSTPNIDRFTTPDFNSRTTFGSPTSLNVDKLSKKNEDRLRRLRDLQGDDLSLYDPEDVLDRFMTKQGHNRRTYDDDYDGRSNSFSPSFRTPLT